jgi:hypothetical protein
VVAVITPTTLLDLLGVHVHADGDQEAEALDRCLTCDGPAPASEAVCRSCRDGLRSIPGDTSRGRP